MIEVFIPEYSVFWGLMVLNASVLTVKLRWRKKGGLINKAVLAVGVIVFAICMVPLASVPLMIRDAKLAYTEAFGTASLEAYEEGFKDEPFSLQDYFLGTRTSDYIVTENVLFYEGTEGADAGKRLHFDVYMPTSQQESNPVLVRIHGGSWTMGDKGPSNYSAINKHFANLGYVVFDIQYGLSSKNESFAASFTPDSIKGDFTVDDMVRHIGIFTSYLADHGDEYGADINSVFISGASAGGQLAVASALGITGGKYAGILDTRLNIKGLIPYYPANGLPPYVGLTGPSDLVDPAALVDGSSPPCLIFHGTHDGIVAPAIATALQEVYASKSNAPCALLWMSFAGHGSDFYTPGYYNQVFNYFMERFMKLYR
jgi:acetyl esterase/lipase